MVDTDKLLVLIKNLGANNDITDKQLSNINCRIDLINLRLDALEARQNPINVQAKHQLAPPPEYDIKTA